MVGHHPILMVGVAALIHDHAGRVLLMKRTDNLCWGPPGGSTEPGERIEESLRREVLEETGINLGDVALFGAYSGPEFFYTYPNGDQVFNVTIIYFTHVDGQPQPTLDHEHSEWAWFDPQDIPTNISPPMKPIMADYQQKQKNRRIQ